MKINNKKIDLLKRFLLLLCLKKILESLKVQTIFNDTLLVIKIQTMIAHIQFKQEDQNMTLNITS